MVDAFADPVKGNQVKEFIGDAFLYAPEIFFYEMLSALRKLERFGDLPKKMSEHVVEFLEDLPVGLYPVQPLVGTIWSLRQHVTVNDAAYVAVARSVNAPLLTSDYKLSRAHDLKIEVITM